MKKHFQIASRIALALGLVFSTMSFSGCEETANADKIYGTQSIAPSFKNLSGDKLYDILGSQIVDKGVNFAVYAKNATRVEVLIFDSNNPDTDQPIVRLPMVQDKASGIWTLYVYGVGYGTHYGYIAFGPNWKYSSDFYPGSSIGFETDCDEEGNRYNPNKLLIDPYARRIHRDFDWGSGNPASGTARNISDWKAAAKSVVIKSEYQWSNNETQWRENRKRGDSFSGHAQNDLIVYEVHPKGFTKKALDINNPGTWRGIGEKAEYLRDLGITAVELMPVAEKPDDGTYWGYNTIAFFAPEQRFATEINQGKLNCVHDEFKEMVDKLHQAGIEVILDVVYNHTGEGGFWRSKVALNDYDYGAQSNFDDPTAATIYSFRGLDNKEYYHLVKDSTNGKTNQLYLDQTGVGNQMRTNNKPFKRLIIDNLRFWVEEMHVDGFRFDLAAILGVTDDQIDQNGDKSGYSLEDHSRYWVANAQGTVLQDIIDDPVLAAYNTRLIAEPWSVGQYVNGYFQKSSTKDGVAWYEWNGRFRDMVRPLINDDNYSLNRTENLAPDWQDKIDVGNILTGSSKMFGDDGRKPYHSVNFLTAHDGFTLYDLVTYNEKRNDCGKLNPICCNDRYNAFCDLDSGDNNNHSRNWCSRVDHCWEAGCDGDNNCWEGGCSYVDGISNQGTCDTLDKEALKRQMLRNYFAMLMVTPGTPMILGGDEYMRTQFGNNNAYSDSADNEWNWFRWGDWQSDDKYERMHDFVRSMIKIRKTYSQFFAPKTYEEAAQVGWWWPEGSSNENGWGTKSTAMAYPNGVNPTLFVLINMENYDEKKFYLRDTGKPWKVLVDTQSYYDNEYIASSEASINKNKSQNVWLDGSHTLSENTYTVKPRSIVIVTNE